jgi:heme/copper-type cytochrome/quinol oxidase subunit 3
MLACLGIAAIALSRGDSKRLLSALTLRVALAVAFFLFLMLAWYLGWIEPHGLGE